LAESHHADTAEKTLIQMLGRDTRRYVPAAFIPAAASLASVYIFTRIFDSSEYGGFSLVVAAVALAALLMSGWVQQSILRYLPGYAAEGRTAEFSTKTKALLGVICLFGCLPLILFYFVMRSRLGLFEPLFLPAVVLLITEITLLNLNTLFQAELRSRAYAGFRITGALARLAGALIVVLFFQRNVTGLVIGMALGQLLLAVPMWWAAGRTRGGSQNRVHLDGSLARSFAAYGIPVIGWTLGGQILGLSDRFIIGAFRGNAEVGVYSASYNLVSMGFGLVATPLLMAAHPIIMNAWQGLKREEIPGIVKSFSRYYLIAALPVVAIVSALGREIVQVLLGPEFRSGYTVIPWVLGGAVVWGLGMYGHKGLELLEKTRLMFALVTVSAVVNLVLNIVFVPLYGFIAAAISTFVSYLLYPVLVYGVTRRGIPWNIPWKTLFISVLGALIAAVCARLVAGVTTGYLPALVTVISGALAGLIVYAVVILATGEIRFKNTGINR
jgi:O-antigen/teichoic acid export membrane protein